MVTISIKLKKTSKTEQQIINYLKNKSDYIFNSVANINNTLIVILSNKHNKTQSNILHDCECLCNWLDTKKIMVQTKQMKVNAYKTI